MSCHERLSSAEVLGSLVLWDVASLAVEKAVVSMDVLDLKYSSSSSVGLLRSDCMPSRDVRLGATCAAMSSVEESCSLILTIFVGPCLESLRSQR